jgi:circadian clock protein KaiB
MLVCRVIQFGNAINRQGGSAGDCLQSSWKLRTDPRYLRLDDASSFKHMTVISFILYVSSHTPNSIQAEANLKSMCLSNFPDNHQIEIVDVSQQPDRALADGIIVTPTLVKVGPGPKQVIMGNLSNIPRVLSAVRWDGTK